MYSNLESTKKYHFTSGFLIRQALKVGSTNFEFDFKYFH